MASTWAVRREVDGHFMDDQKMSRIVPRIGTRQFKADQADTDVFLGITARINEWMAMQTDDVRIINIETLYGTAGYLPLRIDSGEMMRVVAVQVWYEVRQAEEVR